MLIKFYQNIGECIEQLILPINYYLYCDLLCIQLVQS